ncbi:hypothetical protein [Aliidiomarina soli]|uniref:Uncharacterized protein n=1 Tax=Aliidiomarina soli TaxID=1928574 RepID=A0A432WE57_9GAMM|nr:hypothetical protein [Aliidiomarina soli]RUO31159.1 hypothetical protein CWE14_11735 [Aliidiomarina soli]
MIHGQQFVNLVKRYFYFLVDDYGFSLISEKQVNDTGSVRYQSSDVYVNLSVDQPGFELNFVFGRIGIDDQANSYSFEQGDLILLECCHSWVWHQGPESGVELMIKEFARLLKNCGDACLRGDSAVYSEMRTRRDEWVGRRLKEQCNSSLRKDAEKAWQNKDYQTAVKIYRQLSDSLTDVEKKKFVISEKF